MKKFSKGNSFGKRDSGRSESRSFNKPRGESRFGAGRRDAIRSSSSRGSGDSFEATCENCGKMTDLPFKPTGSKQVYCRDCFNKSNTGASERSFDRNDRSRDSGSSSKELDKINAKIDKIMKALKIE